MQTIGKYVAAFILVLASSYFNPSAEHESLEKEVELHVRVIKTYPCMTDMTTTTERDPLT